MDVGIEAGLSKAEQVYLREAAIVLQAHTLSDIVTVDGTRIKRQRANFLESHWGTHK